VSVKFDFDKYEESSKSRILEVGKKLSENYYSGSIQPINEGELIALDWVPSSGSLYCTELNTDIHLHDVAAYSQCGFDYDALSEFVSSSAYTNIEYIFSDGEENISPGPYWVMAASQSAQKYDLGFSTQYLQPMTGQPSQSYNTDTLTYYVKNIPLSTGSLEGSVDDNILDISRDKNNFREFMETHGFSIYMTPTASSNLSNNVNGDSSPDVVVKEVGVDNKRGLTFSTLTESNRVTILSSSLVEQFMESDVTDRGYPITMRSTALVYHQSINQSGSLWLRPSGSKWFWEYDRKYVESGSDQWSFNPSGVVGHFGAGTKVYMADDSLVNIESINTGSAVKSAYMTGSSVTGVMFPTMSGSTDDRIDLDNREAWRSYLTSSLDSLIVTSSLVESVNSFDFHTWVTINGHIEVSPCEALFVKSGSVYKFVDTKEVTTDYKLIAPDKSEIDITSVQLTSGSYKTFYGLDLATQDIYFVSESLFVEEHHTIGANNPE